MFNIFGNSIAGQIGNGVLNAMGKGKRIGALADYISQTYGSQPQTLNTGTPALGQNIGADDPRMNNDIGGELMKPPTTEAPSTMEAPDPFRMGDFGNEVSVPDQRPRTNL